MLTAAARCAISRSYLSLDDRVQEEYELTDIHINRNVQLDRERKTWTEIITWLF